MIELPRELLMCMLKLPHICSLSKAQYRKINEYQKQNVPNIFICEVLCCKSPSSLETVLNNIDRKQGYPANL